uniref:Shugoshin C-terminal domain-containing protein n=1 Tax=Anopheles farauti TaxID=69004 RepID=A0A182QJ79_9DIPT
MEFVADPGKALEAYRIINKQFADATQKLRHDLYDYEQRYNCANEMWLAERQENKALRDMVRKLKDQLQMITKVMVSVQEQSENLFERINRPHEMAENMMRNYTPRAAQVYERRRTEYPPYVDEDAIREEEGEERYENGVGAAESEEGLTMEAENETVVNGNNQNNLNASDIQLDHGSRSTYEQLPTSSPLVQRLKRPSRNTSFDESFETIDHDRVVKLSRRSLNRRKMYTNLQENEDDLQSIYDASNREIDEVLRKTLQRMSSPVRMEEDDEKGDDEDEEEDEDEEGQQHVNKRNSSSETSEDSEPFSRNSKASHVYHSRLKKSASESMLPRPHHESTTREADRTGVVCSVSCEENELTVFNPSELIASCSTPVVQRDVLEADRGYKQGRRSNKTKSENELNTKLFNPVVLVKPLTIKNVQQHEETTLPKRRGRLATGAAPAKQVFDSSNSCEGTTTLTYEAYGLEQSSSVENLSVLSGDSSYRPRRRTAPKSLREPSLRMKLRRK